MQLLRLKYPCLWPLSFPKFTSPALGSSFDFGNPINLCIHSNMSLNLNCPVGWWIRVQFHRPSVSRPVDLRKIILHMDTLETWTSASSGLSWLLNQSSCNALGHHNKALASPSSRGWQSWPLVTVRHALFSTVLCDYWTQSPLSQHSNMPYSWMYSSGDHFSLHLSSRMWIMLQMTR